MANQTGRPIAPARKLVAAVMGTLAVFVIVFGLGMSSMAVAFFGVAVLALAITLAMVNLSSRRGGRATVAGNAEVKSIPPPPMSSAYGRAEIEAIVVAPGLGTFETVIRESRVPVAKWPVVGGTVPITVDVDDTRRVRVNWNDAPVRDEGADPPPPQPATDFPGTYPPADEIDDDVLGVDDPAPWEGRDRDWVFDPDEPPPPPPPRAGYSDAGSATPVVVRDTPTGTIVEGQLVDADEEPPPLPRRAAGATRSGPSAEQSSDDTEPATPAPDQPPAGSASSEARSEDVPEGSPGPGPHTATAAAAAAGAAAGAASDPATGTSSSSHPAGAPDRAGGPAAGSGEADTPRSPSGDSAAYSAAATPGPGSRTASDHHAAAAPGPGSGSPAGGTAGSPAGFHGADAPRSTPGSYSAAGAPGPGSGTTQTSGYAPGFTPSSGGTTVPTARTASARPPGSRPSPKPRGSTATATVERETPSGTPEASPATGRPPTQRTSSDNDPVIDVPLDEPAPPTPAPDATTAWAPTGETSRTSGSTAGRADEAETMAWPATGSPEGPAAASTASPDPDAVTQPVGAVPSQPGPEAKPAVPTTSSGQTRFFMQPGDTTDRIPPQATPAAFRQEPTPTSTTSAPSPVSAPPTAPTPDRPFPTAPPPSTSRPAGPATAPDDIDIPLETSPAGRSTVEDPVDIPLDDNPEPAPETAHPASQAMADGIIAPPADSIPAATRPSTPTTDSPTPAARSADSAAENDTPSSTTPTAPAAESAATPHRTGSPWGDFGGAEPDDRAADVITAYPSARPGPAGAIHGVGITVLVTDLDRSIAFYRDILGFFEIDSGDGSAVLASGDTRLVLRTVHNLAVEAGRLIYLNLEVGDVDAVYDELRAKGVKFVHSPRSVNRGDKLELWSATFRDPDNHNIAITQWRAVR